MCEWSSGQQQQDVACNLIHWQLLWFFKEHFLFIHCVSAKPSSSNRFIGVPSNILFLVIHHSKENNIIFIRGKTHLCPWRQPPKGDRAIFFPIKLFRSQCDGLVLSSVGCWMSSVPTAWCYRVLFMQMNEESGDIPSRSTTVFRLWWVSALLGSRMILCLINPSLIQLIQLCM